VVEQAVEPIRVLVVDDDVVVKLILSFELPGVELIEAGTTREGLETARREKPDAIIVDRRLPDGDGLELVRALRGSFATAQTPILVLTAGHEEAQREAVTRAGADDYLAKPFDAPALLARLESLVAVPAADLKGHRAALVDRLRRGQSTVDLAGEADIDLRDRPGQPDDVLPGEPAASGRRWFRRRG
jgi:DNA-binding response OmpR family regulator